MREGERPALPADAAALPGGTFPGLPAYVALLQRCWAQEPQARPSFDDIVAQLRALLAALPPARQAA